MPFAQEYAQCLEAYLNESQYQNVEGLRDDLYYACILFQTRSDQHRKTANALLENADWHSCPYSGLPAVQLLTEYPDALSAAAAQKIRQFLEQGQDGWREELNQQKWNSFALLAAASVLGYGVLSGNRDGLPQAQAALEHLVQRARNCDLPDEFLSPFYTALQLAALAQIQTLPLPEPCREAAGKLERFTWHGVLRHFRPGLLELTGVYSRGYTSELAGHFQVILACIRRLLDDAAGFTFCDTLWNPQYVATIVPHGSVDGMRLYALYFSAFSYACAPEDRLALHVQDAQEAFAERAHTDASRDVSSKRSVGADVQYDYPAGEVHMTTRQQEGFALSWLDREYENGMACPSLRVLYRKDGATKAFFTKLVRDETRYIGQTNEYPNLGLRLNASNFPDDGRKTVRTEGDGLVLTYWPRGFCRTDVPMKLDLIFTVHFSPVDGVWVDGRRVECFDGKVHYPLRAVTVCDAGWSFVFVPRVEAGYWKLTQRNNFLNVEWVQPPDASKRPVWELFFCSRRAESPSARQKKGVLNDE